MFNVQRKPRTYKQNFCVIFYLINSQRIGKHAPSPSIIDIVKQNILYMLTKYLFSMYKKQVDPEVR